MAERSLPQAGNAVGDAGPYTSDRWAEFFKVAFTGDQSATQGVLRNYLQELLITTGGALAVRVSPGAGFCYGHFYLNTAYYNISINAAGAGGRTDRVVMLQNNTNANYDGSTDYGAVCVTPVVPRNSTRVAVLYGVEPNPMRPLMTGPNAYMVELARYTITGATMSAITDYREYCQFSDYTDTDSIADNAVTPAKIPNRTRKFLVQTAGGWNITNDEAIIPQSGRTWELIDNDDCFALGSFAVPSDYVSGMTVTTVIRTLNSGNVYGLASAYWGPCAGNYGSGSAQLGYQAVAITQDHNTCILQLTLTGVSAGDIVSLEFRRDGTNVLDTVNADVWIAGWLVQYTADS